MRSRHLGIEAYAVLQKQEGYHGAEWLSQDLKDRNGWRLTIVKRKEQAFKVAGLNWIVERSFAWLGRQRRTSMTSHTDC